MYINLVQILMIILINFSTFSFKRRSFCGCREPSYKSCKAKFIHAQIFSDPDTLSALRCNQQWHKECDYWKITNTYRLWRLNKRFLCLVRRQQSINQWAFSIDLLSFFVRLFAYRWWLHSKMPMNGIKGSCWKVLTLMAQFIMIFKPKTLE